MTRLAMWMVAALTIGCSPKPSADECRKAITNMQTLMGTENLLEPSGVESEVRRCRGGSTKKAVDCAVKATSLDELHKCDFYKGPIRGKAGSPAAAGSAGAAGSAAAGSAAAGSAATGSAATGSAAGGSAATGSGDGAAGSAASGSADSAGSAAAGTGSATP